MKGSTDLFRFLTERRHSKLRELLSSYIDGEVTDAERARVEGHLATCDACREELESLRWTVSVLREMPEVQTSRSFAVSAPSDRAPERPRLVTVTRWAASAAAVLLVALVLSEVVARLVEYDIELTVESQQDADIRAAPAAAASPREVVVEKEVVKTVEVPGETVVKEVIKIVEVTGETVVVEKEVIKEVEVPGETVVVEKEVIKEVEVPGETVVVEKEVIREVEVPGETVVVEKEVSQDSGSSSGSAGGNSGGKGSRQDSGSAGGNSGGGKGSRQDSGSAGGNSGGGKGSRQDSGSAGGNSGGGKGSGEGGRSAGSCGTGGPREVRSNNSSAAGCYQDRTGHSHSGTPSTTRYASRCDGGYSSHAIRNRYAHADTYCDGDDHADTHRHAHANHDGLGHSDCDCHSYAVSYCDRHNHTNCDRHRYANTHRHTHADRYGHTNSYGYAHAHAYCDSDT